MQVEHYCLPHKRQKRNVGSDVLNDLCPLVYANLMHFLDLKDLKALRQLNTAHYRRQQKFQAYVNTICFDDFASIAQYLRFRAHAQEYLHLTSTAIPINVNLTIKNWDRFTNQLTIDGLEDLSRATHIVLHILVVAKSSQCTSWTFPFSFVHCKWIAKWSAVKWKNKNCSFHVIYEFDFRCISDSMLVEAMDEHLYGCWDSFIGGRFDLPKQNESKKFTVIDRADIIFHIADKQDVDSFVESCLATKIRFISKTVSGKVQILVKSKKNTIKFKSRRT